MWLWCGVRDELGEDGYLLSSNTVFVYHPEITKWEHHTSIGTAKHGTAVTKFGKNILNSFFSVTIFYIKFSVRELNSGKGMVKYILDEQYIPRRLTRYVLSQRWKNGLNVLVVIQFVSLVSTGIMGSVIPSCCSAGCMSLDQFF